MLLSMKREIVRLDNVWGVGGGLRPVKHLVKEVSPSPGTVPQWTLGFNHTWLRKTWLGRMIANEGVGYRVANCVFKSASVSGHKVS